MIRKLVLLGAFVLLAASFAACSSTATPADPAATAAAKTMEIILTEISGQILQSQTHALTPTPTDTATATITATFTTIATVDLNGATPFPTRSGSGTAPAGITPLQSSPAGPTPTTDPNSVLTRTLVGKCNAAFFVDDVGAIQDNSEVKAGASFTKTWAVRNIGFCTWNRQYQLFYFSGQHMKGPDSIEFPEIVAPNRTFWLSVTLIAPQSAGIHIGRWYLRDAEGTRFGVGLDGDEPLMVRIKVVL
jgi:hypothetical protein